MPGRSRSRALRRLLLPALVVWAAASLHGLQAPVRQSSTRPGTAQTPAIPEQAAWLVRDLSGTGTERLVHADILNTPVQPGSVMKLVTLAAALESGVVRPDTTHMCRRVVTIDGRRYVCAHPDLKRPLTAVEALAHSCNDFFLALAPRLSRAAFNDVRARIGLAPLAATTNLPAALIGLDGPRATPRALLDGITRLLGFDRDRPVRLPDGIRRTLLAGMREAATQGSASEFSTAGLDVLAKTGTGTMPGGGTLGLTVAFEPANAPRRAVVVVAPGAAGRDAVSIAVDLLRLPATQTQAATGASRDTLRIGSPASDRRLTIATLALEDYVARVVAAEGEPRAPEAAAQALAIAARTFAQAHRGRHASEGYDLCDTTHCQVLRSPTPASRRAAATTAGRILTSAGRPAPIYYSASCGGHTERPSRVWPGASDPPFLPAQPDQACGPPPVWTSAIGASDLERSLRAAGHRGTVLRSLRIVERSGSGRVTRLAVEGFSPAEIDGDAFRLAVGRTAGWQWLKSTLFDLRRDARGYTFIGRGFGHGVGMCVQEAACRATAGASVGDILAFYYPGTTMSDTRAAGIDVQLALPAREEGERHVVTNLVRTASLAIAGRAGIEPPHALRVAVYPSADAFRRVTGQPWWVAGTTRGTNIHLLPVSTLRMRGLLEQTIRHEVAHAVVDVHLAGKPLWVREGAAAYFAEPEQAAPATALARCPSDADIQDAASADALREAYALAESCFRSQIASGRRWTDVR